ncbi:hypothetical protein BDZ94DRAFT_1264469 [Collybia nuda]|uniref:Fungal-type protein kinase domain-containing protein n=1 Tax=Collybia nuda TaxID=64659 RepID=A0A9P5Y4B2_9AGAR|nr:hypothetical protein BDZ94DRAFT_1264469 [Collybia nuda]
MPPPDAVFVGLTDEESDYERQDSDTDSLDKSFTSDKAPSSALPPRPVTSVDFQLIAHASEALNVPGCNYTTCTAVQSYSITLWYYDRTCMVRTFEFDLRHERKEFALFAYGISHNSKTPSTTNQTLQSSFKSTFQPSFTMVDPTKITIPSDTSEKHDATYTIVDTIYTYHALIGRGTKVFAVTPDTPDGNSAGEQVLKLAWPNIYRPKEIKLVEAIVAAAPRWQAHLPQITFSATFSADQLLPRLNLLRTLPFKTFHDRYLHVMAMLKYQKLWEVDNVEEFQDAFVDCVECHFHSYEEGKVLHCDLSENNLMCKRECGRIQGVLNDWDMASPVDANGDVSPSTKSFATGTIPFMAYDLLGENPPPHLYRHDLESFMYILIWAAIHYDFTTKQKLPIVSSLAGWDHKSRRVVRQAKGVFLFDANGVEPVFQHVRQEFKKVLEEWIIPLHAMFAGAMAAKPKDTRTCDGRITFQTFMDVLGRKPR